MLYNIFLLILIIILLSIKIYKNKDEFFNEYTEINNFQDKGAEQTDYTRSCKVECDNLNNSGTQTCYAYQHVGTANGKNICRISKNMITSQNLIASTLNNPLHIAECSKPTEAVNPCDDGGIEKARRNKLKIICLNKNFVPNPSNPLTKLCNNLPVPCP